VTAEPTCGAGAPVRGPSEAAAAEVSLSSSDGALLVTTFYVRDALFALDTALVEEVVRPRRTTRVAHSPAYVLGIMNLRGKIVTVLDLAQILQLGQTAVSEDSRLYIVPDGDGVAGLLVDRVADVIEVDPRALEPPPASVSGAEARFIRGIARTGERLVTVLDALAVLASERV
jgi:purine-binding chemotaxis protein CheW